MKLIETGSPNCKILLKKNKKYIVRYPRELDILREYYRFTPEYKVINILEKSNIKVPKTLKVTKSYFIQEFIDGKDLSEIYKDHRKIDRQIIKRIILNIMSLISLDFSSIMKYTLWNNNSSFYIFQCNNTLQMFQNYYDKLGSLYEKLGISSKVIEILLSYSSKIDNDRKLVLIHGDRHKKNMILNEDGEIVFIDWELGGIGDIAYDIAFHLHQMAYTKEDEIFFLQEFKKNYVGNKYSLMQDIKLYRLFILVRSCIYHVFWTDSLMRSGNEVSKLRQLRHFMRRYNRLSKFEEFEISSKSEAELMDIFSEFINKKCD